MTSGNDPNSENQQAYELPDAQRPASATPTESEVEREIPNIPALDRSPPPAGHDPYAVLRFPNYRFYVTSYSLAVIGGQIQTAAIDWELYQRTRSPMLLGILGLVQFLPIFLLSLPAGQVADLFSRKKILLLTQVFLAFWGLCMAVLSYFFHDANLFVPLALAVLALNGVTLAFARPARASILPHLVPAPLFSNAATWNSSMFEIASMVGPALGGLLIHFSTPLAYLLNSAFLVCCFIMTLPLPNVIPERRKERVTFSSLVAGVKYVFRTDLLLATMTLDLFAVLLGGATYLLPIFATDILHVGSLGYGLLRSAPAVGALCMAMILAHMPPMQRAGRNLLLCVAGFGAATIVFGLSRNFALSLAMLFLTGAFDNVSVVVRHTLVQLLTPDTMRGRVSAVNQVFIGSSNELGGLESGVTAAWFGPVASVVAGGIGTIVVVTAIAVGWKPLRRLGSLVNLAPEPAPEPRGFPVINVSAPAP